MTHSNKRLLQVNIYNEFKKSYAEPSSKFEDTIHDSNLTVQNGCVENEYGYCWFLDGALHREDGPAVHYASQSYRAWFVNGVKHREDGPAEIWMDVKRWWINGIEYTKEDFNQWLEKKNLNSKLQSELTGKPEYKRRKI